MSIHSPKLRILLVGTPTQQRTIRNYLQSHRAQLEFTGTANATAALFLLKQPHVLVLCTNQPGKVKVGRRLAGENLPLVVIAFGEANVASLLDTGADRCNRLHLCTPGELKARLCRFQRQASRSDTLHEGAKFTSQDGRLHFTPSENLIIVDDKPVRLTKLEGALLAVLMSSEIVHSSESLQSRLWADATATHIDSLRLHVYNLRRKLNDSPTGSRYIETIKGIGYRFRQPVLHGFRNRT